MIKYILLFSALSLSLISHSQYKKIDTYTINEEFIVNVGDELTIGEPSSSSSEYLYIYVKPSAVVAQKIPLGVGVQGGVFEIIELKELKKPVGGLRGGAAIFKIRKAKFMVDLESAIQSGEIIITN